MAGGARARVLLGVPREGPATSRLGLCRPGRMLLPTWAGQHTGSRALPVTTPPSAPSQASCPFPLSHVLSRETLQGGSQGLFLPPSRAEASAVEAGVQRAKRAGEGGAAMVGVPQGQLGALGSSWGLQVPEEGRVAGEGDLGSTGPTEGLIGRVPAPSPSGCRDRLTQDGPPGRQRVGLLSVPGLGSQLLSPWPGLWCPSHHLCHHRPLLFRLQHSSRPRPPDVGA